MTYEQAFEYVGSFTKSGTPVKDLIRFVILMRLLGNPQNELKIVHVAGTNGKGSVCEYISNAVKADNKSVGKFTSPYIDCIEERQIYFPSGICTVVRAGEKGNRTDRL